MKKLFTISLTIASLMCEANTCKTCVGQGVKRKTFTCEYCEGSGTVPTEQMGKSAGVTTWTETTYKRTGNRTIDNVRYKKFSDARCPGCASSSKKAGTVYRDACCETCQGLGIVEPYTPLDLSTFRTVCNNKIKELEKICVFMKKMTRGMNEDDEFKKKVDSLRKSVEEHIEKLKSSKKEMSDAVIAKDVSIIEKNKEYVFSVSTFIDKAKLINRQYELEHKYNIVTAKELNEKK